MAPASETLPAGARVIVIGAGIVGCSAAYHLATLGWSDIVVLDQGPLFVTGGSTSHAPGLMFQVNASKMMCELARYSVELYSRLQLDGQPVFHGVGGLEVASTSERWEELKRKQGHALSWGLEAHLIGRDEIKRHVPMISADRLHGAIFVPSDGVASATRVAAALAEGARDRASFFGDTGVTGIEVSGGRVRGVTTTRGRIAADTVLLSAGIWGPLIGRMAGVPIPLQPVQHLMATTAPLPELKGQPGEISQPIVRHQDRSMYFRQRGERYLVGAYRHEPLLVEPEDLATRWDGRMPSTVPFNEEAFRPSHQYAIELFPGMRGVPLEEKVNGLFSFTPDTHSLIGESLDVRGFWVAEAVWITHGGGAGRVVAEWMTQGVPSLDLHEADLNRFYPHVFSRPYIRERGAQNYREVYDIIHPLQQMEHPRNLRLAPYHQRFKEQGAVFFEAAGWERPQWYEANEQWLASGHKSVRRGWSARYSSPIVEAEHRAARERVVVFDATPFTKLEVEGRGALAFLQRIAANQMDHPIGKVTYTAMLNDRGGIECDLTVTRIDQDRFWVVTGGGVGMHDLAWIRRQMPADGSVHLTNLTSGMCCIGLWGPAARELLQAVTAEDVSNRAFPYLTARRLTVGFVPAFAIRISYVGELGWEIYAPTEYGLTLWDSLWRAGQALGVTALGGGAFDSLRLEKGYRLWGADIHSEYNPYEAGIGFAVRVNKGDFSGRAALLRAKQEGIARKLTCLTVDDDTVMMGKEPILSDGEVVGFVTSANYGYTVGKSIVYGYLPLELSVAGRQVEVQYFGERHSATVVREPLFDPDMMRLKDLPGASPDTAAGRPEPALETFVRRG